MRSRIQILYVIGSLDLGGSEKQLYLLLKHLNRDYFDPEVVVLSRGGYWTNQIKQLGVDLIVLERRKSFEFRRLTALMQIINARKPDIVHGYQMLGNRYSGLAGMLHPKTKLVFSCRGHAAGPVTMRKARKTVDRLIDPFVSMKVYNSQSLFERLHGRDNGATPGVVIYNGIETEASDSDTPPWKLKRIMALNENHKIVGTVGRLIPFKNHRLFLEIAHEVLKRSPETYFMIIGDGPLRRELEAYSKSLGTTSRVLFLGQREDVRELLQVLDVFLFTSIEDDSGGEGLPNAVMEAMLAGLPCVVSSIGGTAELFLNGQAGYVIPPTEKATYIQKTLNLLQDESLRKKLGTKGRSLIIENHSVQRMAKRFERLYQSILKNN